MYNYTTLIASIQNTVADNDTEFVTELPTIIKKAEHRVLRDTQLELFEDTIETAVTIIGNRLVAKPAGVLMITSLWWKNGTAYDPIEERGYDYCLVYAPDETADTGDAKYYAELESNIYLSPTPTAVRTLRMKAIVRPDGLAAGNLTTWLGTHMGDVLFQAALIESWMFLKNQERMNEAAQMYASLLPQARAEVGKLARRTYAGVGTAPEPTNRGQQ
jgi:hypothetical protein